ncbi:MAG TPA: MerR family transcriptional regulator [Acidimicrobiales bacterium]|nr:MerR family transcriptional regulator [Acidimicrobiales bacterium]
MAERTYLSIGDVLSLLKDEFPDITISKIRFLESQGLLDPERTPSGYRKFYEEDVDRLRWILRQQRENFLPLKVIKGRLVGTGGTTEGPPPDPEAPDLGTAGAGAVVGVVRTASSSRSAAGAAAVAPTVRPPRAGTPGTPAQAPGRRPEGAAGGARLDEAPERGRGDPAKGSDDLDPEAPGGEAQARESTAQTSTLSPAPAPAGSRSRVGVASQPRGGRLGAASVPAAGARAPGGSPSRSAPPAAGRGGRPEDTPGGAGGPEETAGAGGRREEGGSRRPAAQVGTAEEEGGGPLSIGLSGVNLTAEELSDASGLSADELGELERYGLLVGRPIGDTTYFDEENLTVARLAAGFRRFGIEARHLRMYRTAADREASFFEQIVMPLLKQRNPAARRRAVETLAELTHLGQGLRGSLLRTALKDNTGG